ncbi:MAG: hypothetical protein ABUT20_62630 [Bacteroidota bacterium]
MYSISLQRKGWVMYIYSYDEIFEARKLAAKVVALYGDLYLPIFNRLHEELIANEQRNKLKELALEIAL